MLRATDVQQLGNSYDFEYHVFISHATGDGAEKIAERLAELGVKAWIDRGEAMSDAQWTRRINKALRASRFVLLYLEPEYDALKRPWVAAEVKSTLSVFRSTGIPRLLIGTSSLPYAREQISKTPLAEESAGLELDTWRIYTLPRELPKLARRILRQPAVTPAPNLSEILAAWPAALTDCHLSDLTRAWIRLLHEGLTECDAEGYPALSLRLSGLSSCVDFYRSIPQNESILLSLAVPGLEAAVEIACAGTKFDCIRILCALGNAQVPGVFRTMRRIAARETWDDLLKEIREWLERADLLRKLPQREQAWLKYAQDDRKLFSALRKSSPVEVLPAVAHEVAARVDVLRAQARWPGMEWEVFFRDHAGKAGLDKLRTPNNVAAEHIEAFLQAVSSFSEMFVRDTQPRIWCWMYDVAVLVPLLRMRQNSKYADRAVTVFRGFVSCLQAPVLESSRLLRASQSEFGATPHYHALEVGLQSLSEEAELTLLLLSAEPLDEIVMLPHSMSSRLRLLSLYEERTSALKAADRHSCPPELEKLWREWLPAFSY